MLSLDKILSKITQQPEYQEYRQYQQLIQCWRNVVNLKIYQNTRPLYFSREILGIATSSAVWAQELTLQRYSLVKKLNKHLDFGIRDIRFTPAQWDDIIFLENQDDLAKKLDNDKNMAVLSENKAKLAARIPAPETVHASLQSWLTKVEMRSRALPFCPNCDSPTPQKELERWNLCCHCMAQEKHLEYRPTTFSNSNSEK